MAGYGDDGGFDAWLAENGYALPGGAPTRAVLRQRGSVYLDGLYGARFVGSPTGGYAQERAWPREDASAYGTTIANDEVPVAIIEASYYAAYQEALNPGSLASSATDSRTVKREKVDVIEVEYFEKKGTSIDNSTIKFAYIEGLVTPFLSSPRGFLGAVAVV